MQKIQAGHLEGSVILVGSVGSSVPLLLLLLLLLLLPLLRSTGSGLTVANLSSVHLILGLDGPRLSTLQVAGSSGLLMALCSLGDAGASTSHFLTSAATGEEAWACGPFLWPNSGFRMFSTEKGRALDGAEWVPAGEGSCNCCSLCKWPRLVSDDGGLLRPAGSCDMALCRPRPRP